MTSSDSEKEKVKQKQQLQLQLSSRQQEIIDAGIKKLTDNLESFEGIRYFTIKKMAHDLVQFGVTPSKVGGLLIDNLVKNKEVQKKTSVTHYQVYKVLQEPEFKALKDQKHADSKRGRGMTKSVPRFDIETRNFISPTCVDVLREEVKKLKEQNPRLPNQDIRNQISNRDLIKLQFSASTLKKAWPKVLRLQQHIPQSEKPESTVPPGLPLEVLDKQKLREDLIKRMEEIQKVLKWLSGMEEWERMQFKKELPKEQAYSLALRDRCSKHMEVLVRMMPEDTYLDTFLWYSDELDHLIKVFDEKLYIEKQFRKKKHDLGST